MDISHTVWNNEHDDDDDDDDPTSSITKARMPITARSTCISVMEHSQDLALCNNYHENIEQTGLFNIRVQQNSIREKSWPRTSQRHIFQKVNGA